MDNEDPLCQSNFEHINHAISFDNSVFKETSHIPLKNEPVFDNLLFEISVQFAKNLPLLLLNDSVQRRTKTEL